MSIATMEELTALPVNSTVEVNQGGLTHVWTRSAEGLRTGAVNLNLDHFIGAITAGNISALEVVDADAPHVCPVIRSEPDLTSWQEGLHLLIAEFDNSDDRNRLTNWMVEVGMEAPSRSIEFRIRVSGETRLIPDVEIDGVDVTGVEITTVNWEVTIEQEEDYSGTHSDPCEDHDHINDDWVRQYLDDMGIDYSDLTIDQRRCSGC